MPYGRSYRQGSNRGSYSKKKVIRKYPDAQLVSLYYAGLAAGSTHKMLVWPTTTSTAAGVAFPATFNKFTVRGTVWNTAQTITGEGDIFPCHHFWAIMLERNGETIGNGNLADLAEIIKPEKDVIIWGRGATFSSVSTGYTNFWARNYDVYTPSGRALKVGDKLQAVLVSGENPATGTSGLATTNFFFIIAFNIVV